MRKPMTERGQGLIIVLLIILIIAGVACYISWAWPQMFPSDIYRKDYMTGKAVVAFTLTTKTNEPVEWSSWTGEPTRFEQEVLFKVCFRKSGECFPNDDTMLKMIGGSEACGVADNGSVWFKVFDATPGGIMRYSFRGVQPMGDKECPVGNFIPYPEYNPDLDPDSILEKLGWLQDCWLTIYHDNGIPERIKCSEAEYVGYPNIKSVAPAANSPEVYHLVVVSDDGVSLVPLSFAQELAGRNNYNFSLFDLPGLIDQINGTADDPNWWEFWNYDK